jgi:hypothetical protein
LLDYCLLHRELLSQDLRSPCNAVLLHRFQPASTRGHPFIAHDITRRLLLMLLILLLLLLLLLTLCWLLLKVDLALIVSLSTDKRRNEEKRLCKEEEEEEEEKGVLVASAVSAWSWQEILLPSCVWMSRGKV